MRVLVACEFSGVVRDAFLALGHDAVSCDLLPSERPGPHIRGDVLGVLGDGWDLMVAFPPCTALCLSGNHRYAGSRERAEALGFVRELMGAPVPRWALENPLGVISSAVRRPDLIINPWEYGHAERKRTCLWLHRLPPLMVDDWVQGPYEQRVLMAGESKDRWRRRSRMFEGVARAMAEQWGSL